MSPRCLCNEALSETLGICKQSHDFQCRVSVEPDDNTHHRGRVYCVGDGKREREGERVSFSKSI